METRPGHLPIERRRFLQTTAAAGLGLCGNTLGGSRGMANRTRSNRKFERSLVLGMDGLDPRLALALMEQGKLPNFASLADSGTFGPLQTSNPVMSPVAWSNIAAGAGPGHHGIFDFLHRDPDNYMPYISLRRSSSGVFGTRYQEARQAPGFWRYTSDAGIPTTVLRWPVTFPPEKVNGRFLSGLGVPDLLGTEGQYTVYTTAPPAKDDPSGHSVIQVQWRQTDAGLIQTVLRGPQIGRGRFAETALIVQRKTSDTCMLHLGGDPAIEIRCKRWTPWIKVTFRAGLKRVRGMVKLLLLEVTPQFKLVVSPIHLDPADPAFDISFPPDYTRSLDERIGAFHTLGMPEMVHPLSHQRYGFDAFLDQVQTIRDERKEMFLTELEQFRKGVFAFVFDHTDRIQHAFWATRDPTHPMYDEAEAESYRDVIEETYREMDAHLGEVVKRIDRKTLLLVVSDHGFGTFRRQVHLNRWLIDHGYMRLKGPQKAEGRGLFQDVDWRHTKAYAVGFSSIYLNRSGREAGGVVKGSEAARKLQDEIAVQLQTLVDADSGNRMVRRVYHSREIYRDGPRVNEAPDLVVGLEPGYRASWQTALGGARAALVEDNDSRWSGDHIFDPDTMPGIILSNAKLSGQTFRGTDIAPTVLAALGLERPRQMTGRDLLSSDGARG